MRNLRFLLLLILPLMFSAQAHATVQLSFFTHGDTVMITAKSDATITNVPFTALHFSIRHRDTVTLTTVLNPYMSGATIGATEGTYTDPTDANYDITNIDRVYGSGAPNISMDAGKSVLIYAVRVSVPNPDNVTTGLIQLVNEDVADSFYYYFELNFQDSTNYTQMFYNLSSISAPSGWTYGEGISPLPVKLMSLNLYRANETSVELKWSTASEENNRGFYVERSADGRNWTTINFVSSLSDNGNSQSAKNYQYTDYDVYRPWKGTQTFYYRLKQQDFNGKMEYVGGIKTIKFSSEQTASIQVYPNPAQNFVNLKTGNNDLSYALIYDANGRILKKTSFSGSTTVDVSRMRSGIYRVQIIDRNANTLASDKLIINR